MLCLIYQNGRHFQVATNFLQDVILEVKFSSRIAMSISDIMSFGRCYSWNIGGDISFLIFDVFCDAVTSSVTSWTRIYINIVIISWYLYTGTLMIISLFVFSYHEKCSHFIHKVIWKADFEASLRRHRWRHDKNTLFDIIFDDLFIFAVKFKLCLIFLGF